MDDFDDSPDYLPALIRGLTEAIEYARTMVDADIALASAVEEATLTIVETPRFDLQQSAA